MSHTPAVNNKHARYFHLLLKRELIILVAIVTALVGILMVEGLDESYATGNDPNEGGIVDCGTYDEYGSKANCQHCVEQIAVEVIARLQEEPHRKRGGNEAVNEQHHDPNRL